MFVGQTAGDPARSPDTGMMILRVQRIGWEAPRVLSVDLRHPEGLPLPPVEPGAHLDLHLPGGVVRQYSLCGDPGDRTVYRIGVLDVAGGRGSRFVHQELRPGQLVTIGGPRNNFRFDPADAYLFVAGGIGITPMLPMVREASRRGVPWTLHYCVRSAADAPFLDELAGLPGGDVTLHASAEGTRLSVERLLATPRPGALVYCCGPERLMRAVEDAAVGWPANSVRFEWFCPKTAPAAPAEGEAPFEVVCARSGVTVAVAPGVSILDALEAQGVTVPSSCQQGICGTCETQVIEGVPDHRDSILNPAEQASGKTMMICVSRCRTPRLVLDV